MKTIISIIIGMFLISSVSAIYGGECSFVEFLNTDNVELEITKNSSNMDGFNWTKNGTIIEYCFDLNYKPDNFTLHWFNYQEVEVSSGGGSSSGSSSYIGTYYISEEILIKGYIKTIFVGGSIAWKNHIFKITNIKDGIVTIQIQSETIYITLKKGEISKISLENNCYLDLYIKVNRIGRNYANIKIQKIDEVIEGCKIEQNETIPYNDRDEIPDYEIDKYKYRLFKYICFGIIILLLLYVIFFDYINNIFKRKNIE